MATLDPGDHTFIGSAELPRLAETIAILHLHRTGLAVQDQLLVLCRNLRPWLVNVNVFLFRKCHQHAMEVLSMCAPPRSQGTITKAHRRIGNDKFRVNLKLCSESIAVLTSAVWRVERKVTRRWFIETGIAFRTCQMLAKGQSLALLPFFANEFHACDTVRQLERGLKRVC